MMNNGTDHNPQELRPQSSKHVPINQEGVLEDLRELAAVLRREPLLRKAILQTVAALKGLSFGSVEFCLHVHAERLVRYEFARRESFEAFPANQSGGGDQKVIRRYKLRKTDQGNKNKPQKYTPPQSDPEDCC
jgi:hypothetical protein